MTWEGTDGNGYYVDSLPKMEDPLLQFNDEAKNLEILSEECAEVIQIKSKITRFGIDDLWPRRGMTNREALEQEVGHVLAMVDILIANGTITPKGILEGKQHKFKRLEEWYSK